MLSERMISELCYFAATVVFGVVVSFLYHLLLFLRAILYHGVSVVDAEDILFFGGAGLGFFYVVYCMNDGILRWYAFFGAFLGAMVYIRTVARLTEPVRKWLLQKQRKTIKIRKKHMNEDRESEIEGITSQSKPKKRKKEDRAVHHCGSGDGSVRGNCL